MNLVSEIRCEVPLDQHVSDLDNYFRGEMKLGAKKHYSCMSGYRGTAKEATCTKNGWTPNPLCAGIFSHYILQFVQMILDII